jgi:hypothetical protein
MLSQVSLEKISEKWEELLLSDDSKKNYLFPHFLEISAKRVYCGCDTPLTDWISKENSGSENLVLAGILPFSNQNSILVWMISSEKEKKTWTYYKELDFFGGSEFVIDIEFGSDNDMSILINKKRYVAIPDIRMRILFSRLTPEISDMEKYEISDEIWGRLNKLLENKLLFDNNFSDYSQLSTVISSNKKVKICTWNIEYDSGEQYFFGGLVVNTKSKMEVYKLVDSRKSIRNQMYEVLKPEKWYGCIYYGIIENKFKGDVFYTLLGFNGNNAFTQIKLIDILTFSDKENSSPKFGATVFDDRYKKNCRMVYEYGKNVTMMLRYDINLKMIVMDNLVSSNSFFQNDFRFYGPDLSHNGLKFENGKWIFYSDIELRNPEMHLDGKNWIRYRDEWVEQD